MYYTAETLHNGNIAIPDRIVNRCYRKFDSIIVSYNGQDMTIPPAKLRSFLYKGDKQTDKFGRKPYKLAYYKWLPDSKPTPAEDYKKYFT